MSQVTIRKIQTDFVSRSGFCEDRSRFFCPSDRGKTGERGCRVKKKSLKSIFKYGKVNVCDIFNPCSFLEKGPETTRRYNCMNKYELTVVVSAKLEDEERAATLERVKEVITRFGGTVTDVDDWGKRKLAYEIQKMREAYYYFVHFEADGTCPAEVENRVRIMEDVIRYLCVRLDA